MQYQNRQIKINAIQWKGYNLKKVIDFIGLHPSANKWTWEEYEKIVEKEGLKLFFKNGTNSIIEIGNYIKKTEDDLEIILKDVFELFYEPCGVEVFSVYAIDKNVCVGCGACKACCPADAITEIYE